MFKDNRTVKCSVPVPCKRPNAKDALRGTPGARCPIYSTKAKRSLANTSRPPNKEVYIKNVQEERLRPGTDLSQIMASLYQNYSVIL